MSIAADSSQLTRSRTPSTVTTGVVVWLSSEVMFFAGLFAAYFSLRTSTHPWPPQGVELTTTRTGVATLVLLASSGSMHFAVRAAERGDRKMATKWLAVTMTMGAVFLGNQIWDFASAPFDISSHAYGSIFYVMTGFHGLHVLGGILLMLSTAFTIRGADSKAPPARTLTACGYYWHFVDAVWVVMFLTIFVLR